MLTTIKGYYGHGQVYLSELPPVSTRTEVLVTFLTDEASNANEQNTESISGTGRKNKDDEEGYVILESGLGIDG